MAFSLALDFGTTTGYAVFSGCGKGEIAVLGSWTLLTPKEARKRVSGEARAFDVRVLRLRACLRALAARIGEAPQRVAFEDVQFATSTAQAQLWAALRAAAWMEFPHAEWSCVANGTLKKFATGDGHADKAKMLRKLSKPLRRFVRFFSHDDNAIDALWVGRWAGFMEAKA